MASPSFFRSWRPGVVPASGSGLQLAYNGPGPPAGHGRGRNVRRFFAELSALVVCAALCAAVSNHLAGRERKLTPVGRYPNAQVVPQPAQDPAPGPAPSTPPAAPAPVAAASSPGPVPAGATTSLPAPPTRAIPSGSPSAKGGAGAPAAPEPLPGVPSGESLLSRFPPHPDRPFAEVSGTDALWAHSAGVPFLDARRTKVYEEGHVVGARSFSVWESDVDQKVFALQDEVPAKDRPVVLYCSGGECEDSHMLAEKLFGAGFVNALVYRDGWPDWQKRGGPSRSGPRP